MSPSNKITYKVGDDISMVNVIDGIEHGRMATIFSIDDKGAMVIDETSKERFIIKLNELNKWAPIVYR